MLIFIFALFLFRINKNNIINPNIKINEIL